MVKMIEPEMQSRPKSPQRKEDDIIAEWKSDPLVPNLENNQLVQSMSFVEGKIGKEIQINGSKYLNFACHNYLGFSGQEEILEEASKCVEKFGVGTGGSRVLLGTTDVHVKFEQKIADFFGCEMACLYSHGFSTIATAIPVYAKPSDIVFADEASNFAIQKGLDASRCKVRYFKHNDIAHLIDLLEKQAKEDEENPTKANQLRRFLVVEGIYLNTGNICRLDQMIKLKDKYKLRIFIDESISFGTLGPTGRGITEHFKISMDYIDLILANLEYNFGSIGGFCVGDRYVVDRQMLTASGYVFTTSQPAMLTAGTIKALEMLEDNPELTQQLQKKCLLVHKSLSQLKGLKVSGDTLSPVKHLQLANKDAADYYGQKLVLQDIVRKAKEQGIALVMSSYLDEKEAFLPRPSIRIACSRLLDDEEINDFGFKLSNICNSMFSQKLQKFEQTFHQQG